MRKGLVCLIAGLAVLLLPPPSALAQDHGGGGGGGCGDVFGDLIHILRAESGQAILQQRWIELPKEVPGYGWGYCTVAVDASGEELGFAPLSCDVAEEDLARVVPVDYFGRLNGGRTKERNNRMHFNEVISTIKDPEVGLVKQDATGRLALGYECVTNAGGQVQCAEWSTVDSPMESLGLYSRTMKYGHLQTNPEEVDAWHAGDPKLPTPYQPALGPDDWAKFHQSVRHLLPLDGADPSACFTDDNGIVGYDPPEPYADANGNGIYDEGEVFTDMNGNEAWNVADGFDPACGERESLDERDFTRGGIFLGAAANKTGFATTHLVQYINRILKIAQNTPHTLASLDTLPALVRTCSIIGDVPTPDLDDEEQFEPSYDMSDCEIADAPVGDDPDKVFPDLHERFVNFAAAEYLRLAWRNENVEIIQPVSADGGAWEETTAYLPDWLAHSNGPGGVMHTGIGAFVEATGDTIRSIEFVHNYEIPEELWAFGQSEEPEPKTVKNTK